MYRIEADGVRIYDDTVIAADMKVINPKLTLEDSSAGSLTVTLVPGNVGYDTVQRMTSDITVIKDGEEIWWGRVLSETRDFWNQRQLTCEGALAFLNDVSQPTAVYDNYTIYQYFERLITVYNTHAPQSRQFQMGAVTVESGSQFKFVTDFEKTIECINKVVDEHGGHLRVRKANGHYILDYLEEYPTTSSQTIEFGKNLLEFTRNWNSEEFATVIVPLGARLEESRYEDVDERLTVSSVNQGSIYVVSNLAETYGWIEKVVEFSEIDNASVLLQRAQLYLADAQFDDMQLELSALDMHYLNADYAAIKLLDKVKAISAPHGMNRFFPVRKMEIPLDQPENTVFSLGDTVKNKLTTVNNALNTALINALKAQPKQTAMLDAAKANAQEILDLATTGYITITKDTNGTDAIYISDTRDYTEATKYWKWSMNGLAYWKSGDGLPAIAMTMDGSIVADFITSGVLNGDLLNAGSVKAQAIDAGAITAGKIASGAVTANTIDSGAVTADKIQSGAITADKIESGAVTTEKLSLTYRNQVAAEIAASTNGLTLSYSAGLGTMSGTLSLNNNGIQLDSETITMNGAVTFNDLSGSGSSVINGDNITTGTISGRDVTLNLTNSSSGSGGHIYFKNGGTLGASLYYDNQGAGTIYEAANRVYLTTEGTTSFKVITGGGISMQSNAGLYLYAINDIQLFTAGTMRLTTASNSTAYLNGYPIITSNNISSYMPSSVTAKFG